MKANEILLFWIGSAIINFVSYFIVNRNVNLRDEWPYILAVTIVGPIGLFSAFLCIMLYYQDKKRGKLFENKNK